MRAKVKIVPTFTIVMGDVEHRGFTRGGTWNNLREYRRGDEVVIVADEPPNIFDAIFNMAKDIDGSATVDAVMCSTSLMPKPVPVPEPQAPA